MNVHTLAKYRAVILTIVYMAALRTGSDVVSKFYRPGLKASELQTPNEVTSERPLVLLAFHLIKSAIHDAATGCDREAAANSLRWLRSRTRWPDVDRARRMERWGAPGPPSTEARQEYVFTFDWAIQIIGTWDGELVR